MVVSNTSWLDRKYIRLISYRFEGFVTKSANLFNGRCPFCGDSKTHQNKKRFYFYLKSNGFVCHCHNCSYHSSFKNLLKRLDNRLFQEYCMEQLTSEPKPEVEAPINTTTEHFDYSIPTEALKSLQSISQLPANHPAKRYVVDRKIPAPMHSILRWCPEFKKWTNGIKPGKFASTMVDEGRVLVPFFSANSAFFAYTGRAIYEVKNGVRYILIILDYDIPLLYGVDTLDRTRKGYVVEGPLDSMFLPNCIGLAGSNFSALTSLKDYANFTVIIDNEPRKKETVAKIEAAIDLGYRVCIWPSWVEYKDINQMVVAGWTPDYIVSVIDASTYTGFAAKLKHSEWRQT